MWVILKFRIDLDISNRNKMMLSCFHFGIPHLVGQYDYLKGNGLSCCHPKISSFYPIGQSNHVFRNGNFLRVNVGYRSSNRFKYLII